MSSNPSSLLSSEIIFPGLIMGLIAFTSGIRVNLCRQKLGEKPHFLATAATFLGGLVTLACALGAVFVYRSYAGPIGTVLLLVIVLFAIFFPRPSQSS